MPKRQLCSDFSAFEPLLNTIFKETLKSVIDATNAKEIREQLRKLYARAEKFCF
jgi:hypothetical protein